MRSVPVLCPEVLISEDSRGQGEQKAHVKLLSQAWEAGQVGPGCRSPRCTSFGTYRAAAAMCVWGAHAPTQDSDLGGVC